MPPDSEMRIEALKKAYAEIILNTSKEAACRVMAAERKALCFHHDLVSLKEESLAMFLRLKENFNSKITEAEAKSCSQEMKIEELEAQLSEAEGIIVDLRDELTQVQEEFDVMRRNQKQPLRLHETLQPAHECVLQENTYNSYPLLISPVSNQNVPILHPMAQLNKCSHASSNELSSKSDLDQFHAGKYDITSIIMEDRETEVYKNGSTQRIRAFERNLSNVNVCSLSEDNQPTVSVHPETKQEDSGNNSHYPMTDTMENGHQSECAYIETVQKKNKKRGKSSDELNSDSGKSLKTSSKSSSDVSCSEANLESVNITVTEDPLSVFSSKRDEKNDKVIPIASEGKLVRDCTRDKNQTIRSLRRSARKNSRYKEAIYCLKRPYRKKCTKPSQNSFPFHFENPEEEIEKRSENTDVYESVSDKLGTSGEIKPDLCEEGNAVKYNVCNDTVLLDAQLFDVPISEGFGSTQSQTKTQSGNERHLKFTFYRKRRKNMLRKLDETIVIDKSNDNKEVERPTSIPVFGSCNLEDEVNATAHKLVSLSRKEC